MSLPLSLILISHIGFGIVSVIAGPIALGARKGGPIHKRAGRVFTYSMGLSSALGAILGLIHFDQLLITFHAGLLGMTLLMSGVLAARARSPVGTFWTGLVGICNAGNLLALMFLGYFATTHGGGTLFGFAAEDYFFLGVLTALAAIADVSLMVRQHLTMRHRIARHLWRMCTAFFIAAGSAFTGPGADVFPQALKASGILSVPEGLIFGLMLFWLLRTLFFRRPSSRKERA